MLRRVRAGRHSSRNCRPQRHCRGSRRRRNSSGASSCPSHLQRSWRGASGLAHGSAYDAEIWPPLANEVSSAAPSWRSTTVTSWPSCARYHAAVTPTTPAPRTTIRIARGARASARPSPRPAGCSCRTGCGRRTRCRRAPPAASTSPACSARQRIRGERARVARAATRRRQTAAAVCGACFSGLSARSRSPSSIARISPRMAIIASMKRSSSAFDSRFGRLDHQRARHREAHRRRVEAVVHEPLGDVLGLDARGRLERAQVEDALVRDEAAGPA